MRPLGWDLIQSLLWPYKKRNLDAHKDTFSLVWEGADRRRWPFWNWEGRPQNWGHLDLRLPTSRTMRQQISFFLKNILKNLLAPPHGMWDPSSPTRDGALPLHWQLRALTLGLPRKSPRCNKFLLPACGTLFWQPQQTNPEVLMGK